MTRYIRWPVGAALAAAAACALAQDAPYNPSWYAAPALSLLRADAGFGTPRRGVGMTLRFGKPLAPFWDLQLGASYAHSVNDGVRYRQNLLSADALYLFSRERLRPFLLLGGGYQQDQLSSTLNQPAGYPQLSVGAGVQWQLGEQWSAQADLRRVHGFLSGPQFDLRHNDNHYLTLGLSYAFDKPAAPRAKAMPVLAPVTAPAAAVAVVAVAAPRAEVPAPVVAPPAPMGHFMLKHSELFLFGRAELTGAQVKLDLVAAALQANPDTRIRIVGHTDRIGDAAANDQLSLRRAQAVRSYLRGRGVDAGRMHAVGLGSAAPLVSCSVTKRSALIACLAPNRRIEIDEVSDLPGRR